MGLMIDIILLQYNHLSGNLEIPRNLTTVKETLGKWPHVREIPGNQTHWPG